MVYFSRYKSSFRCVYMFMASSRQLSKQSKTSTIQTKASYTYSPSYVELLSLCQETAPSVKGNTHQHGNQKPTNLKRYRINALIDNTTNQGKCSIGNQRCYSRTHRPIVGN